MALPTQVGPYRLGEKLGAGAMGAVYVGHHVEQGTRRAVKLLALDANPESRLRFEREARAQAAVDSHPHVLRVHAYAQHAAQPYLVMDLAPGGDLDARLVDGPLDPARAAALVEQLARGLAHVHARGILHRDLKPSNVLFADDGRPLLADFGLAAIADAKSLTQTGAVLGTASYMAPEQARGERDRVDARTDVYGLGAILYHALCGAPPFGEGPVLVILGRVSAGNPDRPSRLQSGIPPALEAVCMRALARDPNARYPSALEFADALAAASRGVAPPATPWLGVAVMLLATLVAATAAAVLVVGRLREPEPELPAAPAEQAPPPPSSARESRLGAFTAAAPGSDAQRAAVQSLVDALAAERSSTALAASLARRLGWEELDRLPAACLRVWAAQALIERDPPAALACVRPLRELANAEALLDAAQDAAVLSDAQLDAVASVGLAHSPLWPRVRVLLNPDPSNDQVTPAQALRDLNAMWLLDERTAVPLHVERLVRLDAAPQILLAARLQITFEDFNARQGAVPEIAAQVDVDTASVQLLRITAHAWIKLNESGKEFVLRKRANQLEIGSKLGSDLTDFMLDAARSGGLGARFESFLDTPGLIEPLHRAHVSAELSTLYLGSSSHAPARAMLEEGLRECPGHPRCLMLLGIAAADELRLVPPRRRAAIRAEMRACYRDAVLLLPHERLLYWLRYLRRIAHEGE